MNGPLPPNFRDTLDVTLVEIRAYHRRREDFHSAEKRLTLQIKSICRRACGGDKDEAAKLYDALESGEHPHAKATLGYLLPFLQARAMIEKQRKDAEKELKKLAKSLPVYPWVKEVRGFGELNLARLIGETGDLSGYANPAKVWKRMGLAPLDGRAAATWRKTGGLSARDWEAFGYSPRRRSVVFNIGECMIKANDGCYRASYDARKLFEVEKAQAAGLTVWPSAKITKLPAKEQAKYMSEGHIHNRAKRYMEKQLLRDLWKQWTGK